MANLVSLNKVGIQVEGTVVVKGFSLKIKPGEVVAIMGPNGSGKSSLAQAMAGHPRYEIITGSIKLWGKNIHKLKPEDRLKRGIYLAFQNPVSIPGLNLESYLYNIYTTRFPREKLGIIDFDKKLLKLANDLKFDTELLKRSLNDGFSGGEKKRLEVIQLYLLRPKLAILDEIDSGLDVDAMKLVATIIHKLSKKNKMAVLVITHYQRFLKLLKPKRVIVLSKGQQLATGSIKLVEQIEKLGYQSLIK